MSDENRRLADFVQPKRLDIGTPPLRNSCKHGRRNGEGRIRCSYYQAICEITEQKKCATFVGRDKT